jgi:hypothetical protein
MKTRLALCVLGFALAGSPGCEKATSPGLPSNPYFMRLLTAEGDASQHLLSVGDTGFAYLYEARGCTGDEYICSEGAYGSFRSSDTSVATLQVGYGGHSAQFVGRAPSSFWVSYVVRGWSDSMRVDVVAAPLPVDSVRARLDPLQYAGNLLAVATDAAGNLVSVTLRVGVIARLRLLAFRGGDSTVYLPGTVASADTTVIVAICSAPSAYFFLDSGPWGCRVGPSQSSVGVWILGRSPGTASVTVSARSQRYSFLVTVQ